MRDYLQGEKMVQGSLLAWLNLSPYFSVHSDPRVEQHLGPATLHPIVLLYSGWEPVYRAELEPISEGEGL